MTSTIYGYTISASQMARDMITVSGSGTPISVKDIIPSGDNRLVFSSNSPQQYNVYLYGGYLFRLLGIDTPRAGYSVHTLLLDPLSSVYYNGGTIDIITSRIHTPSRCVRQDWGGTDTLTLQTIVPALPYGTDTYKVFVTIVSTYNKLKGTNGDLVRYIIPADAKLSGGKLNLEERSGVYDNGLNLLGYYPSLMDIIGNLDSVSGIDSDSIIDVSYSFIAPYSYSLITAGGNRFVRSSIVFDPNCVSTYSNIKFYFYQIDRVNALNLPMTPDEVSYPVTISSDPTFGYNSQTMCVHVDGHKAMDLTPKDGTVSVTVTPFVSFSGMGAILQQGDNVTTVSASKLPWMGDAWVSYNIQKKQLDEQKMWYETFKSVTSLGVGMGGAVASGGMTLMSVPGSASSLGDAYMGQRYTEGIIRNTPYGNGAPYGDIGSLYQTLKNSTYPPVFATIVRYSGQPSAGTALTRGLTMGYPAVGNDTITADGYYQGEIVNINTTILLNQQLINEIIGKVRRGVQT